MKSVKLNQVEVLLTVNSSLKVFANNKHFAGRLANRRFVSSSFPKETSDVPNSKHFRVRHYTHSCNADLIKNPSPAASLDAGSGGVGSGRSGNSNAARLGITSGNADLIKNR